jgi:NAD(P)H-dependent FMN reductase
MTKHIQLIIGSTREGRIGKQIAEWLERQVAKQPAISLEIVDLKEVNLPFFASPTPPLYAPDTTEHGKAWAGRVAKADGYIFLTPEYNHSIPASLKNALDYLAAEWKGKPAMIIGYGYGSGSFAIRHLQDILAHLKLAAIPTTTGILLTQNIFGDGGTEAVDQALAQYETKIQQALTELAEA